MLKKLGFNAKLKIVNADNYFTIIGNQSTPDLDIGWSDWFEDYPHPNDFFDPLLNGENILPTNNEIFAVHNDPRLNKKIDELASSTLGPTQEQQYAALDKQYMEQAAWAPYGNRTLYHVRLRATSTSTSIIWNPMFEDDFSSFQFK